MIKIFHREKPFVNKVNFVDNHNIAVGYELSQQCCEETDWLISPQEPHENVNINKIAADYPEELPGYYFDTTYYHTDHIDTKGQDKDVYLVVFKMCHDTKEDLFLYLYNIHNGYYSHGFEMLEINKVIQRNDI